MSILQSIDDQTELTRSAIHESGHAIAGELLGEDVEHVVLFDADEGQTRSLAPLDQSREDRMVVILAGPAAEIAFGFRDGPDRTARDWRWARSLAVDVAHWDLEVVGGIFDAEWERAEQLIAEHAPKVAAFSRILLANSGRLAGRQVGPALAAAFGGTLPARPGPDDGAAAAPTWDVVHPVPGASSTSNQVTLEPAVQMGDRSRLPRFRDFDAWLAARAGRRDLRGAP